MAARQRRFCFFYRSLVSSAESWLGPTQLSQTGHKLSRALPSKFKSNIQEVNPSVRTASTQNQTGVLEAKKKTKRAGSHLLSRTITSEELKLGAKTQIKLKSGQLTANDYFNLHRYTFVHLLEK